MLQQCLRRMPWPPFNVAFTRVQPSRLGRGEEMHCRVPYPYGSSPNLWLRECSSFHGIDLQGEVSR